MGSKRPVTSRQSREMKNVFDVLAGLDPQAEPRLAFLRRAPAGLSNTGGTLLCLSASFNPLTAAHLWLIQEGGRIHPPDEVLLVLAKANVDKAATGLSLARRLDLLCRFVASRPTFSVAACSHGRFVDKLGVIRRQYPEGTRVVFLLGLDTLVRLFDPKYYTERETALSQLFAACELVVANRAPEGPEAVERFLVRPEVTPYAGRIRQVRLPDHIAAISATEVRTRLRRGDPVADSVPPEILPFLAI